MTNHMEEVAKLLGVELEEEFRIEGTHVDYIYKISEKGLFLRCSGRDWWEEVPDTLVQMLAGMTRKIIKFPWKPHIGEKFYIPCIHTEPEYMYNVYYWNNDDYDKEYYRIGLICKTSEEAVALTKKMIAMIQEEKKNGQLHD